MERAVDGDYDEQDLDFDSVVHSERVFRCPHPGCVHAYVRRAACEKHFRSKHASGSTVSVKTSPLRSRMRPPPKRKPKEPDADAVEGAAILARLAQETRVGGYWTTVPHPTVGCVRPQARRPLTLSEATEWIVVHVPPPGAQQGIVTFSCRCGTCNVYFRELAVMHAMWAHAHVPGERESHVG